MLIVALRAWCCRVVLAVTLRAVMYRRNSGKAACRSKRRYTGLLVRYRVVSGWRRGEVGEMESTASTALEQSVAKPETAGDYRLLLCSAT